MRNCGKSMKAWESIQEGNVNPMEDLMSENPVIGQYLKPIEIVQLLDAKNHIGNAKEKALTLADQLDKLN